MLLAKAYIEEAITQAERDGNRGAVIKYGRCMKSLIDYLGDDLGCVTLFQLNTADWQQGFSQFMLSKKNPSSQSTLAERLSTLRGICRKAVKAYLLPNVALAPGSLPGPEINGLEPLNRSYDMLRLLAHYSQLSDHIFLKEACEADDAELAKLRRTHRLLGIIILSILCGGIGFDGLSQLKREHYDGDGLYLPHLQRMVRLPESLKIILDELLRGSASGVGEASTPPPPPSYNADNQLLTLPNELSSQAVDYLKSLSVTQPQLYLHPYTHWIEISREKGVGYPALRNLVESRFNPSLLDYDALQTAIDTVARDFGRLTRCWYGIKCISINGEGLMREITREKGCRLKPADFYAPFDEVVREVNGVKRKTNNPFVDRLLFFKSNLIQAQAVQRSIRTQGTIYGVQTANGKEFCAIPDHEISNLKRFLKVKDANRIGPTPDMDHYGKRVRVIAGIYEGCEGVIEDRHGKRHRNGDRVSATLCVRILGETIFGVPNIDRDYLVEI